MRALTGLKQAGLIAQKGEHNGRPAEMPLNKIHADPNNTRRPEDENSSEGLEEQRELTQDIKKRGVRSPISLRPHPTIAGEYMVNFGHRRLAGAVDAGLTTIPYFLDVTFDSYDQVKENLLHRKPSIWALAQFVQRKIDEKQSKSEIAEGLGKTNQNLVTELQALVDAPTCLHRAYASGVNSTRTLYDLRRAYDEFPEQVEVWCADGPKITRVTIQELVVNLRQGTAAPAGGTDASGRSEVASQQKDSREVVVDTATPIDKKQAENNPVIAKALRHDVTPAAPEALLPGTTDQEISQACSASTMPLALPKSVFMHRQIMVEYKGKTASLAPEATVKILVEGDNMPLEVSVSDLLFRSVK